ncbi:MAG: polysaccharide deacetylase family protein [Alteromonas macleodii]|uniref:polysaccharide deacetylase family protein n=1 Tax=Aestuariibacter sp. A3R04 TaxID=2841571 RepID=UPI001C09CCFB|nr:polysaccharide deacetylase family protein [Aestuariibacter sp. A3R04]MBU3023921.1 polysaccharide deacetylase family protein [Aestuariibacter sp. A3R04]
MKKVAVFFLVLVVLAVSLWSVSRARSFQFFGEIISRVETADKVVALTFDDGPWNPKYTQSVINTLGSLNVKATFFLNGRGIESNTDSAQALVSAGHQIGNHTYSHNRMMFKGLSEVKREIDSTNELIRSIGFEGDIYFRPPYGKKLVVLPYYLEQQGIVSVTWDVEPESYDGINESSSAIAEYVIGNTKPGSIVLLHVLGGNNKKARDSLPLIINGLRSKGFKFVTVAELLSGNT